MSPVSSTEAPRARTCSTQEAALSLRGAAPGWGLTIWKSTPSQVQR